MKKLLLSILLLSPLCLFAQDPIFNPAMTITTIGIVDSPIGEEVDKIIDGSTGTKFLDFALEDGMGFIVNTGGISTIATQIEISTANDFPVRDPMNWEISGSNDGSSFVVIQTGNLECVPDRFFSRTFDFENGIDFQWYQINFTNACDPSGGTGIASLQLSEVQLYGAILNVNELSLNNTVKLSPNPSSGLVTLNYNGLENLEQVQVYSVTGKLIHQQVLTGFDRATIINLESMPSGVYFAKIISSNQEVVKRLIIN